jgi:hypothetical protein
MGHQETQDRLETQVTRVQPETQVRLETQD